MTESTTPQLTESEVEEIEARLRVEYEHDIAPHNRMIADIAALTKTLRPLSVDRERLVTGLANLYHAITGETCARPLALGMATSAVSSLLSENAALREQLVHAVSALQDVRHIVGAKEIGADTESWIERLLRGRINELTTNE